MAKINSGRFGYDDVSDGFRLIPESRLNVAVQANNDFALGVPNTWQPEWGVVSGFHQVPG